MITRRFVICKWTRCKNKHYILHINSESDGHTCVAQRTDSIHLRGTKIQEVEAIEFRQRFISIVTNEH